MPTPKQYADALSATPRNSWKYLADAMQPVSEFADEFKVKQDVPLIGGMSAADFTGLKGAFGLADDASYGKYPIRGASLQTAKVDPRVIDAMGFAGALMPVAKNVGKAALGEVARQIHTGTGIGRATLNPRMNMEAEGIPKFPQPDGELRSAIAQRNAALPISEGGLGLPADNMPMDRAGAMGVDTPAYHGSDNGDITKFSNRKAYRGYGTSVAEQPKTAEGYAQNGSMYPLLINKNTIFDVTNPSQVEQLSQVTDKYLAKKKPYDGKTTFYPFTKEEVFEGFKKPHSQYYAEQNLISELVKKMGYTGTKALENNIPQYKIFNPANIRSRFAAFDPFRRHEADILAGVGIGGMLDPEAVSEEFRKKERK